jgi:hypothetical protein
MWMFLLGPNRLFLLGIFDLGTEIHGPTAAFPRLDFGSGVLGRKCGVRDSRAPQ